MHRSVFRPAALVQLVITVFLVQQCFGVTREFAQTYPLRSGGSLELNNVNGTVHIEAWDKDVVEVRAVKTTSEKESNLDRVSINVDSKPDGGLSISTHYPQEEGVEVAVDYTVHVPRSALVTHVNTVNGSLRITDLESVGDLHTVNGNIEVFEGSGNVHAHTTNGDVYLELKRPADSKGALAETTNGSVLLAVPADLPANLEARLHERKLLLGTACCDAWGSSTPRPAWQTGSWRFADSPGNGKWCHSRGRPSVNGLTFRPSK